MLRRLSVVYTDLEDPSFKSQKLKTHKELLLDWFKQDAVLKFVKIILHPPGVKSINIDPENEHLWLGKSPTPFPPALAKSLCNNLASLPHLQALHLGGVKCKEHQLFKSGNLPGDVFQFVPTLKSVFLCDVEEEVVQSLCLFCQNLLSLSICDSNVSTNLLPYLTSLKKLQSSSITGMQNLHTIHSVMLRDLPELKDIGKCDFGSVLKSLYKFIHKDYSLRGDPVLLALETIDSVVLNREPIGPKEIYLLPMHFPNLKALKFVYIKGKERFYSSSLEDYDHLSSLSFLPNLEKLVIYQADFFSHSLFSVLQNGSKLTSLELMDIDEMNLNALMMIGSGCQHLQELVIARCYFTTEASDAKKLTDTCVDTELFKDTAPFKVLRKLKIQVHSPTHLFVVKYTVFFARKLINLHIYLNNLPIGDSFIAALLSWNPLKHLEEFYLCDGLDLTLMAANLIIQSCPKLTSLGKWRGRIESQELEAMKKEIKNRNLNLHLQ